MRNALGFAGGLSALLLLAGCGSSGQSGGAGSSSGPRKISVTITPAGCKAKPSKVSAGPATFSVTNDGADRVSEVELQSGNKILGEAEGVPPGLSGSFSVTLHEGTFETYCPGADQERWPFVVDGGPLAAGTSKAAAAAVGRYRTYLEAQTATLVARTRAFTDAIRAGRLADAKRLYVPARIPYERIEPVAESFGSLDPAIDARAGDVPAAQWTGFHPMEKTLWIKGTTRGLGSLAERLQADVRDLQRRVRRVKPEPAQIANGSVELLGEVSKSKITGEEERYSHTDLDDFEANVDGSEAAYESVRHIVAARKPALAARIDRRFDAVHRALAPYRRGAGFVTYTALTAADTRKLSQTIDALAEPLSHVGSIVVTG
ncbi:MAG TPA: iron uptake system protein EfeO [Gaiellaceae bacterium]|nr:iron uptake system protein EfeO [Gaiellaceae bacterium]